MTATASRAAAVAGASWLACAAVAEPAAEPGPGPALDVGIAVFAPCAPDNGACRALTEPQSASPLALPAEEGAADDVWPEIRRAEGYFMAERAKAALERTASPSPWGAVRVTPRTSDAFDVNVEAAILQSNAGGTEFSARVSDARGVRWFERRYHSVDDDVFVDDDGEAASFELPFADLADDMAAWVRERLPPAERGRLRTIARMRFARGFSPQAFASHLAVDDAGEMRLKRLPAHDDPMLAHVQRIRLLEQRFIDTLDDHYEAFSGRMAMPYRQWREAIRAGVITRRQLNARAQARRAFGAIALVGGLSGQSGGEGAAPRDGLGRHDYDTVVSGVTNLWSASRETDAVVSWTRVLERLGHATGATISPYLLETENRTLRLTGAVGEQYEELRRVLGELYLANTSETSPRAPGASPAADFDRRLGTVDDLVSRPASPLPDPDPLIRPAEVADAGRDARLLDSDGLLFALRPGDDGAAEAPPRSYAGTRAYGNLLDAAARGWDGENMAALFQNLVGQLSAAPGAGPGMTGSRPEPALAAPPEPETELPAGSLEELAREMRERRRRGDDAGALRLLHAGLDRIGLLGEVCPLACSLVPEEPLTKKLRRYRGAGMNVYMRLEKARLRILDGKMEEGLAMLDWLLRRADRMDHHGLAATMRLHLQVAVLEGDRGDPAAAARIYERLLPVAVDRFPIALEATLLWRLAQSSFLAGDYEATLGYLERWVPRSAVMAAACPAVCNGVPAESSPVARR